MQKLAPVLLAFGVLALSATAARPVIAAPPPEEPQSTLPQVERARVATQIYHWVETYFAHWRGVPNLDFDKEYEHYLEQVLGSSDRRAFSLASMELLAKLHNGHSGFDDQWLRQTDGMMLNFQALPVEGKWVVTQSSVEGVRGGEVIEAIDDQPFEQFYQQKKIYISASDERWARRALFDLPFLFPRNFTLSLAGGRKVSIARHGDFRWQPTEPGDITVREEGKVFYIRIPSFNDPKFEQGAIASLKQHLQAAAIIVDVRANHGGSTPSGLIELLMDRPYRFYAETTPMKIGLFNWSGNLGQYSYVAWTPSVNPPINDAYKGRLIILADGGCFSACEDFIVSFKDNHRATIVGERTAGSSGQPAVTALGDGMGIGVSTKRESMPDGAEFEGIGIAPDLEVPLTIKDLRDGHDAALEKAEEIARAHTP